MALAGSPVTLTLLATWYVQMRKEALENDGLVVNDINAPDLVVWDTTRYTDFKKMLIGGEAFISNAQLSVAGGSKRLPNIILEQPFTANRLFSPVISKMTAPGHNESSLSK